jgi:hypothetical protein
MFDMSQLDGPTVVLNFICRRVQPCKERLYPLYEYSGSGDPTRESARNLTHEEVNWWLAQLFDLSRYHIPSNMIMGVVVVEKSGTGNPATEAPTVKAVAVKEEVEIEEIIHPKKENTTPQCIHVARKQGDD